jgi:drug/metabolite transporter (DMT)-like permease
MVGACISIILFFPFYIEIEGVEGLSLNPTVADWYYLLILAIICTVFAYSYSVQLMKRISAFSVNLTVNLEPVYGIVMALMFFPEREKMTSGFYVGTSLILLSVLIYPILNKYFKRKPLDTDFLR